MIDGAGTPESHWLPWLARAGFPAAPISGRVAGPSRALVLAAHPDDEVLGAGGLLHRLADDGWRIDMVWASDGESSHPDSRVFGPAEMSQLRRQESSAALTALGVRGEVTWLGLPDSQLLAHESELAQAVSALVGGGDRSLPDLVLAPWRADGHPDHEVCGRVAADLATRYDLELWELPIWAWHWADAEALTALWPHAHTVHLDEDDMVAKAAAIECFRTQIRALGPDPGDQPILTDAMLDRFRRDCEVVLVSGETTAPEPDR